MNNKPQKRRFNKRLAIDIAKARGVKKPDITAALVAQTMACWQSSSTRTLHGEPGFVLAGWKSAAGLQSGKGKHLDVKGLPWLGKQTILDAIKRLKEAFPNDVKVIYEKKNSTTTFSFTDDFIAKYLTENLPDQVSFSFDYANCLGVLPAILIDNLNFRTSEVFTEAPKDTEGRKYNTISASWLTKAHEGYDLPVIPYSRKEVAAAITQLMKLNVFEKHPTEEAFRVNSLTIFELMTEKNNKKLAQKCNQTVQGCNQTVQLIGQKTAKKCNQTVQLEDIFCLFFGVTKPGRGALGGCNQTGQGCNQTGQGCNQTGQGCNQTGRFEPIYKTYILTVSPAIDRQRGGDNFSLRSQLPLFLNNYTSLSHDKVASAFGLATVEIIISARAKPLAEKTNVQLTQFFGTDNQVTDLCTTAVQLTECELRAKAAGCKSMDDFVPGFTNEVNQKISKYREMRKAGTLITAVPEQELFYELIADPVKALWLELGLPISPITEKPIDFGDFEEQIDLALLGLEDTPLIGFYASKEEIEESRRELLNEDPRGLHHDLQRELKLLAAAEKDINELREFFHKYPEALNIDLMKELAWRAFPEGNISSYSCTNEIKTFKRPAKGKPKDKFKYDPRFFADRIHTVHDFARHFRSLFLETFFPYEENRRIYVAPYKTCFYSPEFIEENVNFQKYELVREINFRGVLEMGCYDLAVRLLEEEEQEKLAKCKPESVSTEEMEEAA